MAKSNTFFYLFQNNCFFTNVNLFVFHHCPQEVIPNGQTGYLTVYYVYNTILIVVIISLVNKY